VGNKNLAKRIREIRKALGLTEVEFAERLGISAGMVSLIESGKRQPTLALLEKMKGIFGAKFVI